MIKLYLKNKQLYIMSVNGKRNEVSIKELTDSSIPDPLVVVKRYPFDPAYRRGSPSRIEGVGSSINGVKGKGSPCRFGQSPRSFAMFSMARRSRKASQTPIDFDALASK